MNAEIIQQQDKNYDLFYLDLCSIAKLLGDTNHLRSDQRIVQELWTTYLFSALHKDDSRPVSGIGFPCKKIIGNIENSLDFINQISCRNTDFDTVIFLQSDSSMHYLRIQNVRYSCKNPADSRLLFDFQKNKSLVDSIVHEPLYLLINIEQKVLFDYAYLNTIMVNTRNPFTGVYAIGYQGNGEKLKFYGTEVYPNLDGPVRVDVESAKLKY